MPPRLRDVTDDHIRMHKVLQDSGLKYVAVMPPHIGEWGQDPAQRHHRPASSYPLGTSTGPCLAHLHISCPLSCLMLFSFLTYFPVVSVGQPILTYSDSVPRAGEAQGGCTGGCPGAGRLPPSRTGGCCSQDVASPEVRPQCCFCSLPFTRSELLGQAQI